VEIGGQDAIFLLILRPYTLGGWLKIKYKKKRTQNHPCVVIGGQDKICLLIFRLYTLGDLLKIKYKKTPTKSSLCGD